MPSRLLMQPRCLPHAPARAPCAPSHAARSRPPICVRLAGGEPHPWRQRPRGRVGAAGAGQAAAPGCLRTHITPPLLPSCVPVQPCPTPTHAHQQHKLPPTRHTATDGPHAHRQHTLLSTAHTLQCHPGSLAGHHRHGARAATACWDQHLSARGGESCVH